MSLARQQAALAPVLIFDKQLQLSCLTLANVSTSIEALHDECWEFTCWMSSAKIFYGSSAASTLQIVLKLSTKPTEAVGSIGAAPVLCSHPRLVLRLWTRALNAEAGQKRRGSLLMLLLSWRPLLLDHWLFSLKVKPKFGLSSKKAIKTSSLAVLVPHPASSLLGAHISAPQRYCEDHCQSELASFELMQLPICLVS